MSKMEISEMDKEFYRMAREHIREFRCRHTIHGRVLEIGPGNDVSYATYRDMPVWVQTLGQSDDCTWKADITTNTGIASHLFDFVFAMEVLEHVVNPFAALVEIRRLLKPSGLLIASAPWGFRIHGPQPDLWRFNQNTWRLLLKDWDDLTLDVLDDPNRWLMPIHINVSARCNKEKNVDVREMKWPLID